MKQSDPVRLKWLLSLVLSISLLSGCSLFGKNKASLDNRNYMTRNQLEEGYSLIYAAASSLRHVDKGLFLKVESDQLDALVSGIAEYGDALRKDMRRLNGDYPGVEIELEPLPEMEQRRRSALRNTSLKRFAPVVGLSGPAFEREMLLSLSGALNQLKYLFRVMAEGEPETSLSEAMVVQERRVQRLYDQVVAQLQQTHFRP